MAAAASIIFLVLASGFWLGQNQESPPQNLPSQETVQAASIDKQQAPLVQAADKLIESDKAQNSVVKEQEQEISQPSNTFEPITEIAQKVVSAEPSTNKVNDIQAESPQVVSVQAKPESKPEPKPEYKPEYKPERVEHTEQITQAKQNAYQVEAVDGVSDDLLARFQAAIDETKDSSVNEKSLVDNQEIENDVKPLTQMPAWVQRGIPSLTFEQHIYASDGEGWVNVNGRDRYEGDLVADGLTIDKILPQQVILTYRGETFSLPALTNW